MCYNAKSVWFDVTYGTWTLSHLSGHLINHLSRENWKSIPKFLSGKNFFKNVTLQILNYRRLSLSQSPEYQTKYFVLSVVRDSQFATSFTLYMYTDCLDHCDYNLHVHVFGNGVLEFKYCLTELLISDTNFEKAVTEIKECWWILTSKNGIKQCSITKVTKATLCTLWV